MIFHKTVVAAAVAVSVGIAAIAQAEAAGAGAMAGGLTAPDSNLVEVQNRKKPKHGGGKKAHAIGPRNIGPGGPGGGWPGPGAGPGFGPGPGYGPGPGWGCIMQPVRYWDPYHGTWVIEHQRVCF